MSSQRPAFPTQTSSAASSAFQSSSSLNSLSSASSMPASQPQYAHQAQYPASAAPLPSPQQAHSQQFPGFEHAFAQQAPQQQSQQQQRPGFQQLQRHTSYEYQPDRGNAGATNPETVAYMSNFALVAEAAKRAQMAVLMRDFEGCEL